LIPAFLQVVTIAFTLSLLSKAVLAAVVIQAPRTALGSQEGVGGGVGVGVGVGVGDPPLDPFEQDARFTLNSINENNQNCFNLNRLASMIVGFFLNI
jgi:hypothetical protein